MKKSSKSLFDIIKNVSIQHSILTSVLVFLLFGSILFSLLPPLALETITNLLVNNQMISFSLPLLYFLTLACSGIFDALKEMVITIFGQKMTHEIRQEMSNKLETLPASYFINNEAGILVSRFVNDVDTVQILFESGIIGMFADICKTISILVVIFIKSKGLGILMIIVTPILFIFTRIVQKRMLQAQLKNRVAIGQLNNHVPETIRNIRMIHVFQKESYMEKKYDEKIMDSYHAIEKNNFYDSIYSPVIIIISTMIIAIMMVLSATGGIAQEFFGMSVGTAVAIIAYVGKVFEPLENIGMEIQNIQSAIAGIKRINEFLKEPERKLPTNSIEQTNKIAIQLQNVSFSYTQEQQILNNLSFTIQKGESVTLAGRTGAGKSTIFKLLLGYYTPQNGHVLIYGTEANSILDTEKRRLLGYVEQNFQSVLGTVYDQIALFDSNLSEHDVKRATQLVGMDFFIQTLPQGYQTPYSDSFFSQGQRQLLSIARAIVANPSILLLDEITANLDSETEKRVLTALQNASTNRTVISISHRLYEQTGGRIITI